MPKTEKYQFRFLLDKCSFESGSKNKLYIFVIEKKIKIVEIFCILC